MASGSSRTATKNGQKSLESQNVGFFLDTLESLVFLAALPLAPREVAPPRNAFVLTLNAVRLARIRRQPATHHR
jgi:hypothetical protein